MKNIKSLMAGLVLLAVAGSGCGYIGVTGWREFTGPAGNFKVMFKGLPTKTSTVWYPRITGTTYFVNPLVGLLDEEYQVEIIAGTTFELETTLGWFLRKGIEKFYDGKIVEEESIDFAEMEAVEFQVDGKDGRKSLVRAVVSEGVLIVVGYTGSNKEHRNIFMNSFCFTPCVSGVYPKGRPGEEEDSDDPWG